MENARADEAERRAIQAWMRQGVTYFGSALKWATAAGTTPTNITRFLKNDQASMSSWIIMNKLARVCPIQPPQLAGWKPLEGRAEDLAAMILGLEELDREWVRDLVHRLRRGAAPQPISDAPRPDPATPKRGRR